jgi:glutamate-1-semialdehyde 2,1-aminomutase
MSLKTLSRSGALYERAVELMPGGVNSPVRAFRAVGGTPVFFERGRGSRLYDVDGREYIDYVSSWGAIILGHADDRVVGAVTEAAKRGMSFGAPHAGEIALAEKVLRRMPWLERIRFVNSGTEASLATIRLARAATGRSKILKFTGHYHGAVDSLLSKAGSGVATFGLPDSAGVTPETAAQTLTAPFNDLPRVRSILEANRGEIAAVLVEPVAGNMGVVSPNSGFLAGLRKLCDEHGALLILDEVMTGFRIAAGGAAERFGIRPDLAIMGKVIGAGLPVGAYGGRADLMNLVAPVGPVYQAGTLSGNPLAMAGGHAALEALDPAAYERLEETGARLESSLRLACEEVQVDAQVQRVGSMISVFFTPIMVHDFEAAQLVDKGLYSRVFHGLLSRGIYLPPSALEAWFLTLSHTIEDIDRTAEAFHQALREAC